jgi:hypothetical protein
MTDTQHTKECADARFRAWALSQPPLPACGCEQAGPTPVADALEAIRASLRAENISYGELAELQALAPHIEPGDTELLEAAGVPEYPADQPSPTPVADALQLVNRVQAEGAHMTVGTAYALTAELPALRKLADAVRSHGIGAELGQLREQRRELAVEVAWATDPANVPDENSPANRDLAD